MTQHATPDDIINALPTRTYHKDDNNEHEGTEECTHTLKTSEASEHGTIATMNTISPTIARDKHGVKKTKTRCTRSTNGRYTRLLKENEKYPRNSSHVDVTTTTDRTLTMQSMDNITQRDDADLERHTEDVESQITESKEEKDRHKRVVVPHEMCEESEELNSETSPADSETSVGAQCCICLSGYEENEVLKMLPCDHEFHTHCVDQWLRMQRTCPVCRSDVVAHLHLHLHANSNSSNNDNTGNNGNNYA